MIELYDHGETCAEAEQFTCWDVAVSKLQFFDVLGIPSARAAVYAPA